MHRAFLLVLLALAACSKAPPTGPAPHQIHVAGASAGFPFTTVAAERLMREDANVIAPLVRAGGTGEGITRFCDGPGRLHPDLILATRAMTPAEMQRCTANGVAHVVSVPIGFTGLVVAVPGDSPFLSISRTAIARALTGSAKRWADVDPSLPALPIAVQGPAPDPAIADELFGTLLAPGARVRGDGAYAGHGANAELVAVRVAATPGAIGLLPYAQALAHRDTLRMLPLDGMVPDAASIASGRYPAAAPLVLIVKADEMAATPGLPRLLNYLADGLAPADTFEQRGLIPLSAAKRNAAVVQLRALAAR
jgi:phosphate transport system substrate-binding protein